jgi:TRAP-type C4-dicarboxylate transport system substrate-binding protein
MRTMRWAGIAVAAAIGLASATAGAEEITLRALSFLPRNAAYTESLLKFVSAVNAAGKGMVQITLVGGPEVTPSIQQAQALKNGVIDMIFIPTGQALNFVPEGDALLGSTTTPMQHRENGGLALLDEAYQKKMNAKLVYHEAGGNAFYLFLRGKPPAKPDGSIDFSGLRIRSAAPWVAFVEHIGGTNIVLPPPEVYTALGRGVVDGTIWPIVGLSDFKWDQYVKYMIEPGFMRSNLVVLANLQKWNALPKPTQDLVQKLGIEQEKTSYDAFQEAERQQLAALKAGGLAVLTLAGQQREQFLDQAYQGVWEGLKKNAPDAYEKLRSAFYRR